MLEIVSGGALPRRDRLVAAIVVEAALGLAAEPAGLDIFHQQRTRPILGVRQPLVQNLHDRKTGIETDEIGMSPRRHEETSRWWPHVRNGLSSSAQLVVKNDGALCTIHFRAW